MSNRTSASGPSPFCLKNGVTKKEYPAPSICGSVGSSRSAPVMDPEDDLYDARVTVLGEYIDHHVKEEREEMFPKARKTDLDLVAMAEELSQRKMQLMEEFKAVEA